MLPSRPCFGRLLTEYRQQQVMLNHPIGTYLSKTSINHLYVIDIACHFSDGNKSVKFRLTAV